MARRKNKIDWLFNQPEARKAISIIGSRELTVIKAVVCTTMDNEEEISAYDKMVQYGDQEANQKAIEWMKKEIEKHEESGEPGYLYFRFIKFN